MKNVAWTSTRSLMARMISHANSVCSRFSMSLSARRISGINVTNWIVSFVSSFERRLQTARHVSTWIRGCSCCCNVWWKRAIRLGMSSRSMEAKYGTM